MAKWLRHHLYIAASAVRAWRFRRKGMRIGRWCKISGSAKLDMTHPRGVVVGDYTAISFDAAILTHDFISGRHVTTEIGTNCFVGARSIVLPGVRIGDNAIVGAGSVVYTDVPPRTVVTGNPARAVETGIVTGKWGIRNPKFLDQEGIERPTKAPRRHESEATASRATLSAENGLAAYLPGIALDRPFADSGIDSFALITLRAQIEEGEGIAIADEDWMTVERPSDLRRFLGRARRVGAPPTPQEAATVIRRHQVNMPQMSMNGLSEAWLFKEIGDMHWSLITGALHIKSAAIADQEGNRLYATFTRIRYASSAPLSAFPENADLTLEARMTRFGAGMFFSEIEARTADHRIRFEVMSSFSRFGKQGDNRSLLKGQPAIPPGFAIPSVPELPDFAEGYREARSSTVPSELFSTDYQIVPIHDINGVGLLYFAAYPIISDICLGRYLSKRTRFSPLSRDICYFANSSSDESIRFAIAEWTQDRDVATCTSTLTRGDGTRMALMKARYAVAAG